MKILVLSDRAPTTSVANGDGATLIAAHVLPKIGQSHDIMIAWLRSDAAQPDVAVLGAVEAAMDASKLLVEAGDVAYLHGLQAMRLAERFTRRGIPVVGNEIDPWSLHWLDTWRKTNDPRALLRAARIYASETRFSRLGSAHILVSEADAKQLARYLPGPVMAIPNGVEALSVSPRPPDDTPSVVFVGALDYEPNIESVFLLADHVLPSLRSRIHGCELRIVGRNPSRAIRALAGRDGVRLIANAADIYEHLTAARIAAFPGTHGRGTRNSVLQAIQAGRPVVASVSSARNIPAGNHLAVVTSIQSMVERIERLLIDRVAWQSSAVAAQSVSALLPRWCDVSRRYESVLTETARSPRLSPVL